MSAEMRDTLGSLAAMALFFGGVLVAFLVALHRFEDDAPMHSGARPDCPEHIAAGEEVER